MLEKKSKLPDINLNELTAKTQPRVKVISALLGLGYPSDTPAWSEMVKLIEKGGLQIRDLQSHRL